MYSKSWVAISLSTWILLGLQADVAFATDKTTNDNAILLEFTRSRSYDNLREKLIRADSKRQQLLKDIDFGSMDYKTLAVIDYENDGIEDEVYVFHQVIREGPNIGDAWIAHYIRYKGNWEFLAGEHTKGDILRILDRKEPLPPVTILNGCEKKGLYIEFDGCYDREINTRSRRGVWFDLEKVKSKDRSKNERIRMIVRKEFKKLIEDEKEKFKRMMNYTYPEELNITGVMKDLNGDGNEDIVATMNRNGQVARNVPNLFCDPRNGCLKVLLVGKSDGTWQEYILGNINCVGISTKKDNGRRDIFKARSTVVIEDNAIKEIDYSPNWMLMSE